MRAYIDAGKKERSVVVAWLFDGVHKAYCLQDMDINKAELMALKLFIEDVKQHGVEVVTDSKFVRDVFKHNNKKYADLVSDVRKLITEYGVNVVFSPASAKLEDGQLEVDLIVKCLMRSEVCV